MTEPTTLTFETGYTRLQAISQRVTSEDVPVSEMCDLFAEGKGLQNALTEYLDEQKGRVEAIERGEGIQAFRIVAPAKPAEGGDDAVDIWDDEPTVRPTAPVANVPGAGLKSSATSGTADDDIPF